MLYKQGKISHIVSQNCDGLHLRSGIPRCKISEVHGNMFIEVCKACKPVRPYVRLFDVTERTNRHRHTTMRRCYICGNSLQDTIVHFGERGSIAWPINWNGASKAAEKADMILCLGSSLKVLRRYPWLWCMDRPSNKRPPLYIVNLQWTPKDHAATLKINGRCDFVLAEVLKALKMKIPEYTPYNDPLLSFATHLHEKEEHTTSRRTLIESKPVGVTQLSMTADVSPNGVITEVRVKNKFTTAKTEFQHMSSERAAESTDTETEPDEKTTDGEEEAEVKQEIGENDEAVHIKSEADEGDMEVSNGHKAEAVMTNGTHPESKTNDGVPENGDTTAPSIINATVASDPGDNNNQVPPHHNGLRSPDQEVSKHSHGLGAASSEPEDEAVTAGNKKPKLESLNDCDNTSDSKGDNNLLHSIMSQIDSVYSRPFPSPDHTYAISPVKEEIQEPATSNGIKTETVEQPEEEQTPTYRGRLRQRKSPKYNPTEEDYFLMCQEELLNSFKQKKQGRKGGTPVKMEDDEEEEKEPKDIEYRTINWPKDALYFSYEPNFLFNEDEDDEIEYVCDCCDPKRRKKKPSSEECSEEEEEEVSDKDLSDDEEADDKIDDGDSNDLLDEDSEDSRGLTSREESPAPVSSGAAPPPARSTKPLPPGWFGKGRSKKRRR